MNIDFQFREKIQVGVLGATGSVGQRFIELLSNHPWFELTALAASEKSVGKPYKEAVNWLMSSPLSPEIGKMIVQPCLPGSNIPCTIVFSGLDSGIAGQIESDFAKAGYVVISNSKNHRFDADVPLLIPEVNSDHLPLVRTQNTGKGMIVTNPNCSAIGLCLALKPLFDNFGLEAVQVVTMQAISGAGYPGVSSFDILDNVIPHIGDEENKMETEPLKIFGKYHENGIIPAQFKISAQCNRVPVIDGHMECVAVKLTQKATKRDIIDAWRQFKAEAQADHLPMAPEYPIHYFEEECFPQPRKHRLLDKGMAVCIGKLKECPILDFKFTLLSHNTIRGAAGGSLLIAEQMVKQGYIFW